MLDPACGTGNFLYVSMELMKRLEGEVLDFLKELGETTEPLRTVDPHQFLGLEFNPRAVPITELVLWIGYIQWWFRTQERKVIAEPILKDFGTVKVADAVLEYDRQELLKDEHGRPITRQDPHAVKLHPITDEEIPDPDARLEVYRYVNPRPAQWPEAEFIVGNPPFIGGKDLRAELGDGYTKALWATRRKRSDSIDYVMYWWDHAASLMTSRGTKLRRFGFITTNSITQKFSRRVLEKHLRAGNGISLVFAVPDHPWQKAPKKAAVRIAMTVAEKGERMGRLAEVVEEQDLDTDQPKVTLSERAGRINADVTIGVDVFSARSLKANEGLSSRGVALHGDGFIVTPQEAAGLGLGHIEGIEKYIRPYRNGRDLTDRPRGVLLIDLFGLEEPQLRKSFPQLWQRLNETVRIKREEQVAKSPTADAKEYAARWWTLGKQREELRPALAALRRFIATVETAKHRFFELLNISVVPDNMLVVVALDDAFHLGVLSSHIHVAWALCAGTLEDRPRYTKSHCFDPFPFPDADDAQKQRIRALAEELDALRRRVLGEHVFLTMTKLYNVREKLKGGGPLDENERAIHDAGCVGVIHELHNKIDAAVAEAYGWPANLSDDERPCSKRPKQSCPRCRKTTPTWSRPCAGPCASSESRSSRRRWRSISATEARPSAASSGDCGSWSLPAPCAVPSPAGSCRRTGRHRNGKGARRRVSACVRGTGCRAPACKSDYFLGRRGGFLRSTVGFRTGCS